MRMIRKWKLKVVLRDWREMSGSVFLTSDSFYLLLVNYCVNESSTGLRENGVIESLVYFGIPFVFKV